MPRRSAGAARRSRRSRPSSAAIPRRPTAGRCASVSLICCCSTRARASVSGWPPTSRRRAQGGRPAWPCRSWIGRRPSRSIARSWRKTGTSLIWTPCCSTPACCSPTRAIPRRIASSSSWSTATPNRVTCRRPRCGWVTCASIRPASPTPFRSTGAPRTERIRASRRSPSTRWAGPISTRSACRRRPMRSARCSTCTRPAIAGGSTSTSKARRRRIWSTRSRARAARRRSPAISIGWDQDRTSAACCVHWASTSAATACSTRRLPPISSTCGVTRSIPRR